MINVQEMRKINQIKMKCNTSYQLIIVLLFFVFQFSISSANASPSISSVSGEFSKNGIVKIAGSNFGAKSPVEPLLWDDLESGNPSKDWSNLENGLNVVSVPGQLQNSQYCFRLDKGLGDTAVDSRKDYVIEDKFYTFIKRRYDFPISTDNHKFFRIYQTGGNNGVGWNYNWGSSYQMRNSYTPFTNPQNPNPGHVISLGANNFPVVGQWQTEEFFLKPESAIGAYDGITAYRLNNNQHRIWAENRKMFDAAHNWPLGKIFVDNYSDRQSKGIAKPGDYIWLDSVYMDKTWSRVLIGDKPVYDNCSKKIEIQYPRTWEKNLITIQFNPGTFSQSEKAYIFVFDADNSVSNGVELTIGRSNAVNNESPQILKMSALN